MQHPKYRFALEKCVLFVPENDAFCALKNDCGLLKPICRIFLGKSVFRRLHFQGAKKAVAFLGSLYILTTMCIFSAIATLSFYRLTLKTLSTLSKSYFFFGGNLTPVSNVCHCR